MYHWIFQYGAKINNAKFTPYEIISNMKPYLPLDIVVTTPCLQHSQHADQFVTNLVNYFQEIEICPEGECKSDSWILRTDLGHFKEGDSVMLKRWRTLITSMTSQVQHRTNPRLFHVILAPDNLKFKNRDMDTRMDFTTGNEDFEFYHRLLMDWC